MNKRFITFEGPEGCGKTTISRWVYEYLSNKGFDVVHTREPGGIRIAEQIRSVILDTKNTEMDGRTEALLYAAARRQHLVQKVIPALEEGKIVICDRFIDSSLAYQGCARGLGIEEVMKINQFAVDDWMPGTTIYLDVRPEVGLERINKNKDREINRLDMEKLEFHRRVCDGYFYLIDHFRERIIPVFAEVEVERVINDVKSIIDKIRF